MATHGGPRPNSGGKRNGSGRPKGAHDRVDAAAVAIHEQVGIMPLGFFLDNMRRHHAAGEQREALLYAREAAPYCHRRLSSLEVTTLESVLGQLPPELAAATRAALQNGLSAR